MGLVRNALLRASENRALRRTLPRYRFIRRAVSRFLPGEELADAIEAAQKLREKGIPTIFTHLGENVSEAREAQRVAEHYVEVLQQIQEHSLDGYVSVKLTQLGLDLSEDLSLQNLTAIVESAARLNRWVWIDMEKSPYVDPTLSLYKKVRRQYGKVGVCLQAYLYRTREDLQELLPLSPGIRLVKGAYAEPSSLAYPRRRDVNANFLALATTLLENVKTHRVEVAIATHDKGLIRQIQQAAGELGLSRGDYEFQLLYGIQTEEQLRLASEGYRVRVLISYGTYWFPWYMRRLAERPANVFFVLKNLWER